ncbi:Uncharacterized protein FKW44_001113 [Caligus rogercresseyi]|uniref:Helicase ATP-binding domain-containing protein n=1 Tax=Caligus rogercresseyi TaxID=217165 RepID=A0A7T8KI94_CALRO|nr:Uncharacterized protein FKW44_001113 [Caligus rogercresseyi]
MTTNGKNQRSSTKEEEVVRKPKIFQGYEVPDEQPLLVKGGVLRNYQIKGFQWMCSLWENGINGILADEMGLGKTLQTISLFAHLVEMGVEGPFLVVAPLSTLLNWVSEIQRFTPDLPVLLFHGNKKKRAQLSRKVREAFTIREAGLTARPIVVTSYEIILNSGGSFRNAGWKYIVVDEGHRLKNNNCRLVRELRLYVTANKLLLTGTPLQNNLAELWSLLNFLMPEIFNDLSMFQSWFSVEQLEQGNSSSCTKSPQMGDRELQILTTLHEILSPFLLRRIKSDIDYKIPPKKEILVYCPMTEHQKTMYKATLEKTIKELLEKDVSKNKKEEEESLVLNYNRREEAPERYTTDDSNTYNEPSDLNYSMRNRTMDLRKVTNHPYLVEYPLTEDGMYYRSDQDMIDLCGKLKVLDQLLGN